ncbi:MAG TPA: hydrogenase maturation nickel metallochaperone HypA [Bryobacteraceae bacterium]|nr:hydrogenase maturation nickel metallochaperone HypA [Bryobacteraceae bacterium]
MHELSIALSIIEGAEEEAARQGGGRVCSVHLRLGPLSGVVKEALLFSYELACEGTALAGSTLLIEDVPLLIQCPQCETERAPVSLQRLQCIECGTPASKVLHGAELEVSALELEA